MQCPLRRIGTTLGLGLSLAAAAQAHNTWLVPDLFRVGEGGRVSLALVTSEDFPIGEAATNPARVAHWIDAPPAGEPQSIAGFQVQGDNLTASASLRGAGLHAVGVALHPRFIELEPRKFEDYLREEQADAALKQRKDLGERDAPGRELYTKFAKTIIAVGQTPADAVARPLGHRLEIVPLGDPCRLHVGDRLEVRVLWDGAPAANVLVSSGRDGLAGHAYAANETTNDAGVASVRFAHPGQWYLRTHRIQRVANAPSASSPAAASAPASAIASGGSDQPPAQWESFWASLTLEVAALPVADAQPQPAWLRTLGAAPDEVLEGWLRDARVEHVVDLSAPQTQYVSIVTTVRGVREPQLDFILPTWRPGRYEILDFAGVLTRVRARDGAGGPLALHKRDKTTWRVSTGGAAEVSVAYDIYANELEARTRHVDETHAFLSGSSVFLLPDGRRDAPHVVRIHAPPDWQIACGLDAAPGQPGVLVAPNYDALIDAPIEIGRHESRSFEAAGRPIDLILWGAGNYDADRMASDLSPLIRTQVSFWGDAPFGRYVFLVHATQGVGGGTEHFNSTIMQLARDGFAPQSQWQRFLSLASHELFHVWNVKALRPAGLSPYNLLGENYTDLLWIAEGATDYYGDLLLVRAGLRTPDKYLEELGKDIDAHRRRPGREVQSVAEASFDAWVTFNQPTADAANSTVSIYREGLLATLALDLSVRRQSDGRRSFDDVLRLLYRRFPLGGPGYSTRDVLAALREVSGQDYGDFFARHIEGVEPLPLEELLALAGIELYEKSTEDEKEWPRDAEAAAGGAGAGAGSGAAGGAGQNLDAGDSEADDADAPLAAGAHLGITLADADGLARVTAVGRDGPAYPAGVQVNDLIVALEGRRLRSADLELRLREFAPGAAVRLTLLRRDELREISVTLDERRRAKWALRRVKAPDESQRDIYQGWLGRAWTGVAKEGN